MLFVTIFREDPVLENENSNINEEELVKTLPAQPEDGTEALAEDME